LSKTEEGEHQVAGMGSVLEEHVKLFAGVLEDVWIQSKKLDQVEVLQSLKTTVQPQSLGERTTTIPRPSLPKTPEKVAPTTTESPSSILTQSIQPKVAIQPEQISRPPEPKPQTDYSTGFGGTTDDFLTSQLDKILNDLPGMTGYAIASSLQSLQDSILERKGFSAVLRQMRLSITELKANPNLLNPTESQGLMNKINFWRSKLRI
jgi:hypothetical protein